MQSEGVVLKPTHQISSSSLVWGVFLLILFTLGTAQAKEGFYIGTGVGGGLVYDDDPVTFTWDDGVVSNGACNENVDCITTNYAEGLGTMFRMGYNIMGVFSIESSLLIHGLTGDTFEGQGHSIFSGVIHPIGIANVIETADGAEVAPEMIFWDPYILAGGGFSWGIYEAVIVQDDKGWTSSDFQWGMGVNMHFSKLVSAGIDMRWTYAFYDKWLYNYDDDITGTPTSDPVGLVFSPMATITLHVN